VKSKGKKFLNFYAQKTLDGGGTPLKIKAFLGHNESNINNHSVQALGRTVVTHSNQCLKQATTAASLNT